MGYQVLLSDILIVGRSRLFDIGALRMSTWRAMRITRGEILMAAARDRRRSNSFHRQLFLVGFGTAGILNSMPLSTR